MTIEQVRDIFDVYCVLVRGENYCNEFTFDVAYYANEILKCTERLENEADEWKRVAFEERLNKATNNLEKLLKRA